MVYSDSAAVCFSNDHLVIGPNPLSENSRAVLLDQCYPRLSLSMNHTVLQAGDDSHSFLPLLSTTVSSCFEERLKLPGQAGRSYFQRTSCESRFQKEEAVCVYVLIEKGDEV